MNQLGYYGKTPHRGDFVRFNLPQSFVTVWDDWLQHVIVQGEQTHSDWSERYQHAPMHRFVLSSGIAGNEVWLGLLRPSQDKVGRRFPFCIAMSVTDTALPCVSVTAQTAWFIEAEKLMTRVMAADYSFDDLQLELADMATHHEQTDPAIGSPLAVENSVDADNLAISVPSQVALQHPLMTPALLDAVLTQTVGEYSLWTSCDTSAAVTTLASGLPMQAAGVALFTGDWQSSSTIQLETDTLIRSVGSALSLFAASTPIDADENTPTLPMNGTLETIGGTGQSAPDSDDITTDEYGVDPAETPPEPATDVTDSEVKEIPSADDWAALDEFEDTSDTAAALVVPEVEPLELDEDDLPEAPWEK